MPPAEALQHCDAGSLAGADQGDGPQLVERNAVAEVVLRSRGLLALDEFRDLPNTGRFVLIEDYDTVGGGIISMDGYPDQRSAVTRKSTNITAVEHRVTADARARRVSAASERRFSAAQTWQRQGLPVPINSAGWSVRVVYYGF